MDIEAGRSDYSLGTLDESMLGDDPVAELKSWLQLAVTAGVEEPTAMALATATSSGLPSVRMVLLRGLDGRGLSFFTNYESRKAAELDANPHVAACLWWAALQRQVRVEGKVERLEPGESDEYFSTRPRASQIASHASPQSQVIPDRRYLERLHEGVASNFESEVPRPQNWGGYRLVPEVFEFWQGGRNRLHDRLRYTRADSGWLLERLAP